MTSAIFFRFCMARVYLVGHSRGGKISALAALEDPRVAALCLLDPVSWGCEEETGMALSEDAVLVYSCCNVHFRPGGLRMWGGSWNDNVWICGACIKLLQCAFQAWWVKGVRRKLQPQALANSSYAGFSLHAFLPLCISSWSVLHHYEYFIMMSVSSWWVLHHDECFVMYQCTESTKRTWETWYEAVPPPPSSPLTRQSPFKDYAPARPNLHSRLPYTNELVCSRPPPLPSKPVPTMLSTSIGPIYEGLSFLKARTALLTRSSSYNLLQTPHAHANSPMPMQ